MRLGLPIKQKADIEVFSGNPVYELPNGSDITFEEINNLSVPERKRIGIYDDGVTDTDLEEVSFITQGVFLPVKNRTWREINHNLVTDTGFNWIADLLVTDASGSPSSAINAPSGMSLGESSVAPVFSDDSVLGPLDPPNDGTDYQAWASGYPIDNALSMDFRSFWAAGQATSSTINEVVMRSTASSTDAVSRITFTTINKGANDTLQITITWNLQNG